MIITELAMYLMKKKLPIVIMQEFRGEFVGAQGFLPRVLPNLCRSWKILSSCSASGHTGDSSPPKVQILYEPIITIITCIMCHNQNVMIKTDHSAISTLK